MTHVVDGWPMICAVCNQPLSLILNTIVTLSVAEVNNSRPDDVPTVAAYATLRESIQHDAAVASLTAVAKLDVRSPTMASPVYDPLEEYSPWVGVRIATILSCLLALFIAYLWIGSRYARWCSFCRSWLVTVLPTNWSSQTAPVDEDQCGSHEENGLDETERPDDRVELIELVDECTVETITASQVQLSTSTTSKPEERPLFAVRQQH